MASQVLNNTLYNYYATSSDVKIFLTNPETNKIVYLDKVLGVGYSSDINSVPIYTIGRATPAFFTKGNFIGQGVLVVPFTDERYIKTSLQYLFDEMPTKATQDLTLAKANPKQLSNDGFRQASLMSASIHSSSLNLVEVKSEFNLVITIDNSSAFRRDSSKSITLKGVKIVSDSFEINAQQENALQLGYKFLFKDIGR